MHKLMSGVDNGQKWIAGVIPMKHNIALKVDTRDGAGVMEILDYLKDFISFQATKISLPAHSNEDIIQELNALALAAIPEYDASKSANMLTFLQNHIRNRIINIYKFATEQRRTAVHGNFRYCKVRCPECKRYSVFDEVNAEITHCSFCGHQRQEGERWRKYPLPVVISSSNEPVSLPDGAQTTLQEHCSYDDVSILGGSNLMDEKAVMSRLAISTALEGYDPTTKRVALLLSEGYNLAEIGREMNLSSARVKTRIRKLAKNKDLMRVFTEYKLR